MTTEGKFELTDGLTGMRMIMARTDSEMEAYEALSDSEKEADWATVVKAGARDHHLPEYRQFVTPENLEAARQTVPSELASEVVSGCEMWMGGAWPMVIWPDDTGAVATNEGIERGVWRYDLNDRGWPLRAELHCDGWVFDPRGAYIKAE